MNTQEKWEKTLKRQRSSILWKKKKCKYEYFLEREKTNLDQVRSKNSR